jgi:thiamine biosynthesis lipoprotein
MSARHVFATMGTIVSIHADARLDAGSTTAVESAFAGFDDRFSLYRPDSELSRIADGRLQLPDSSTAMRDVYEQAVEWRARTRGAFTPHRPDGVIDLSGIVKSLAIRAAGDVLDRAGFAEWMLGCGGDILVRRSAGSTPAIGVVNPSDRDRLLTAIELPSPHRAIATSGVSERGEHIWGPRADYEQVTVIAEDIVTADVLATAILAGGRGTCDEVASTMPVEVLAVRRDGEIVGTRGVGLATTRA